MVAYWSPKGADLSSHRREPMVRDGMFLASVLQGPDPAVGRGRNAVALVRPLAGT